MPAQSAVEHFRKVHRGAQTRGKCTENEKDFRITGLGASVAKTPHPHKDQEHQSNRPNPLMQKGNELKDRV